MSDARVSKRRKEHPKNRRADTFKRVAGGRTAVTNRQKQVQVDYSHNIRKSDISRNSSHSGKTTGPPGELIKLTYYFKTWTHKNTCPYLQHTNLTYITHRYLKIIYLCQYSSDYNSLLIINEGTLQSHMQLKITDELQNSPLFLTDGVKQTVSVQTDRPVVNSETKKISMYKLICI
jgi:hypothetical protein